MQYSWAPVLPVAAIGERGWHVGVGIDNTLFTMWGSAGGTLLDDQAFLLTDAKVRLQVRILKP